MLSKLYCSLPYLKGRRSLHSSMKSWAQISTMIRWSRGQIVLEPNWTSSPGRYDHLMSTMWSFRFVTCGGYDCDGNVQDRTDSGRYDLRPDLAFSMTFSWLTQHTAHIVRVSAWYSAWCWLRLGLWLRFTLFAQCPLLYCSEWYCAVSLSSLIPSSDWEHSM